MCTQLEKNWLIAPAMWVIEGSGQEQDGLVATWQQ